ncbi:caspase-6-like [Galleria mellonella]|uniref:Caspase-6-like n=1 Tax=Galleria mellonella TaxID=7137 RepID=A0A6J1WHV0_GALME|nr:caspase-6-like [Galleria mellonella]
MADKITKSLKHNNEKSARISHDVVVFNKPRYETEESNEPEENKVEPVTVENENNDDKENNEINKNINTYALSKHASTYELETFESNLLVMFHNNVFDEYRPKRNTLEDVQAVTSTFEKFGFESKIHANKTLEEIKKEMEKFKREDFVKYGCIVVVILTMDKDGHLMAKDTSYSEHEIIENLKIRNTTLVTKPRIVIIQSCRPEIITKDSIQYEMEILANETDAGSSAKHYILPMESDMLILHSRYVGNPRIKNGTWFIRTLCDTIDKFAATEDLESIITMINQKVVMNKTGHSYGTRDMKIMSTNEMPVSYSTLTRKLFLRKYQGKGCRGLTLESGRG